MSRKDKAVVLLSGGMDSCVAAAMAGETHELALVHAGYGQRTEQRERRAFEEIADYWGVRERLVVRLEHLALIGGSALTDKGIAVPEDGRKGHPRNGQGLNTEAQRPHRGRGGRAGGFKIQDSRFKTREDSTGTKGDSGGWAGADRRGGDGGNPGDVCAVPQRTFSGVGGELGGGDWGARGVHWGGGGG